jgi:hypothetical protein
MSTTPGHKFYDEQLAYLAANNTDALVDSHYAADGSIIAFDYIITGTDALKRHFRNYMERLGYIKLISTDKFTETADSLFFESTVETKLGVVRVYDAFVLKNGKATHHFTGLK